MKGFRDVCTVKLSDSVLLSFQVSLTAEEQSMDFPDPGFSLQRQVFIRPFFLYIEPVYERSCNTKGLNEWKKGREK
jgi:hypothetical protein